MADLIIDPTGEIWDADSGRLRMRYQVPVSSTALPDYLIRNNEMIDFNAPLKVNGLFRGETDRFPDHGLVHNNTVHNIRVRETSNPVSLLNLNAGDGWVVSPNFIADFAKGGGNRVSYAAFMKSNSRNGVFERNLVVCHWRLQPQGGVRIGLSFGAAAREQRPVETATTVLNTPAA